MKGAPTFLIPSGVARHLLGAWAGPTGTLHIKYDKPQNLELIVGGTFDGEAAFQVREGFLGRHRSRFADVQTNFGLWYRVDPDEQELWWELASREGAVSPDIFRSRIRQGWKTPPRFGIQFILTVAILDDKPVCRAWIANETQVVPAPLIYVDEGADIYSPLNGLWPLNDLADAAAIVVGVGSIGVAASLGLASYGVRHIILVDPDRLLQHNLVRHQLDCSHIGRYKVSGVEELIESRYPGVEVTPLALDVVSDADKLRPLFRESTLIIGATDGVAPRQTLNHLAQWAKKPLVLAAVFDDGGIGEIIRLVPEGETGCLTCLREQLREDDLIEPERTLDLGYGTGFIHRPMTAIGGDLAIVGQLAAKVAVATILEDRGHKDQALAGDHAVIGLRPTPGLQGPFDVGYSGEIKWNNIGSRRPGCPDCDPAVLLGDEGGCDGRF